MTSHCPAIHLRLAAACVIGFAITAAAIAGCHDDDTSDSAAAAPIVPAKDAITKTTELGPVKATIRVWPAKPTLGDPIYARLEIEAPSGITIDAPFQEAGDQRLGRFGIIAFTGDTKRKPDGGQLHEQTYTLEAPASGRQRIPPLRFEITDLRNGAPSPAAAPGGSATTSHAAAAGSTAPATTAGAATTAGTPTTAAAATNTAGAANTTGASAAGTATSTGAASPAKAAQEILTDEIPLEVAPVPVEAATAQLKPALGDLDPDVGGIGWLTILALVAGVAVLGSGSVLAYRALRARHRIEQQRSAYDVAVGQLRALEDKGPPEAETADAWFVALSSIVRRYLEQRYEIRAPELTTEEFLQVTATRAELSAEHRALLMSFLERCDRVKFAGYRPDADESLATLKAARGFVEDTRLREPIAMAVVMPPSGKAA